MKKFILKLIEKTEDSNIKVILESKDSDVI